jgi:serine/threonine protein kinase
MGTSECGKSFVPNNRLAKSREAIKVIGTEIISSSDTGAIDEAVRLFQSEAKAITLLDHPHILPLHDYGEESIFGTRYTYMVMPYRQEGSLAGWLRRNRVSRTLLLPEITHILQQAADALQYAHDHGIIHRDVKPSNFLLYGGKKYHGLPDLQLADFGVAKFMSIMSTPSTAIRGTPIYMAPEMWRGEVVPASDQYALAVMVYELLADRPPFQGSNHQQILYQHMHVQPQPLSAFNQHVPVKLDSVLMKALLKNPEDRYASVSAFASAFERAVETVSLAHTDVLERTIPAFRPPGNDSPRGPNQNRSKIPFLLSIFSGILVIIIFGGLLVYSSSSHQPNGITTTTQTKTVGNQHNFTITPNLNATATNQTYQTATTSASTATATTVSKGGSAPAVSAQITATAIAQTATATAYSNIMNAGTQALTDPLQDNSRNYNWDTITLPGGGGCTFTNGTYHSSMPQQGPFSLCFAQATNFANFTYEVKMQIIQGTVGGIIFRANNTDGSFYYFHLNRNGTYGLDIYSGNLPTKTLIQGPASAFLTNIGQTNLVGVVANGNKIDLYVNMQYITTVYDSTYTSGQMGVVADAIDAPTEVAFSDAKVHKL